ncbi:hypothetical protein HER10_EVM0008420 [Colletotrichum scovillei]|uniref:Leukaemia virus receptor (BLVR) domain-containing protein n=1 Tax=Colletotrichum scovillei TaxID=1209932 RepID=A0A9P7R4E2_9PEZI|nr:uncharacterized protein HER10_EVM0008420 [Colletotrichum scovillei]KAF4776735.1 hypothetical protein HER10_EVM0008420 [Colletotrichum scovillei]KAG7047389.1 bovine leukaemia virus receptor (BLVR) domain-containing protein [Colletotrichum scovillei]KAG7059705.1 bovine leukaemia virus receptor (BLVR) domain-containing protein [Colletotrichum scovillei]KAG7067154.1 bovine leukaemia virus receptor (BLVR) domain-containing protein [Colletotrichum scovillei]
MRRWPAPWLSSRLRPTHVFQRRCFHLDRPDIESVDVPCRSSGAITVDLHNVNRHPTATPLMVYIPPFSPTPGYLTPVPHFLMPYPTAVINYRWSPSRSESPVSTPPEAEHDPEPDFNFTTPLTWPTPLHDVLAGYTWITENLLPSGTNSRRDIYVYSSHAGASIATSLALTESHHHARMAVRGLIAWNGIYNWSMFLPDHKINRPATARSKKLPPRPEEGSTLHMLQMKMIDLFRAPVDLFDPFVSPSLLFQTPGMNAPSSFLRAEAVSSLLERLSSVNSDVKPADILGLTEGLRMAAPRRSALVFPPRKSTLKLPHALLLHDTPTEPVTKRKTTTRKSSLASSMAGELASRTARRRKVAGHTFEAQATELAGLMRRSLEKLEFKARLQWDEGFDVEAEAERRVTVVEVGENKGLELGERGEDAIAEWLEDRIRL